MTFPRKHPILVGMALLCLAAVILVVTLPWWISLALRPVLESYQLTYGDYKAQGWSSFSVKDLNYQKDGKTFVAENVTAPSLFTYFLNVSNPQATKITITRWNYEQKDAPKEKGQPPEPFALHTQVLGGLQKAHDYLPEIVMRDGALTASERKASIPVVQWRQGKLTMTMEPEGYGIFHPSLQYARLGDGVEFTLSLPEKEIELQGQTQQGAEHLTVDLQLSYQEQTVTGAASWNEGESLPASAHLAAKHFRLPDEVYEFPAYQQPVLNFDAAWQDEAASVNLRASAELNGAGELTTVELQAHFTAGLNKTIVSKFQLQSGWIQASLSDTLSIQYEAPLKNLEAATFEIKANFDQQDFLRAGGLITGQAKVIPQPNKVYPLVEFGLNAERLTVADYPIDNASFTGQMNWPMLEFSNAGFSIGNIADIELGGLVNLNEQSIVRAEAAGSIHKTIAESIGVELPEFEKASFDLEASGSLMKPKHAGRLQIQQLQTGIVKPMNLTAEWEGTYADFSQLTVQARWEDSQIELAGSAQWQEPELQVHLRTATLQVADNPSYQLPQPAELYWKAGRNNIPTISVSKFSLQSGKESSLRFQIDTAGGKQIEVNAEDLALDYLNPILMENVQAPVAQINRLNANVNWNGGVAQYQIEGALSRTFQKDDLATLSIQAEGGRDGLNIPSLRLDVNGEPAMAGSAKIPVTFSPEQFDEPVQVQWDQPLSVQLENKRGVRLLDDLRWLKGYELTDPNISLHIAGTPADPKGHIQANITEISGNVNASNIRLKAEITPEQLQMKEFQAQIESHPVQGDTSLPMDKEQWQKLAQGQLPDLSNLTANVSMKDFPLGKFQHLLPAVIKPQGSISADLKLTENFTLKGTVQLSNVATSTTENFASIEINKAMLQLADKTLTVESVDALLGNKPVELSGTVEAESFQNLKTLRYDLNLKAQEAPIWRAPGIIVRADVNLNLVTTGEQTVLSGKVEPVKSFFTMDMRDLRTRTASAESRPPYFSVEAQPFNQWSLDVAVEGERFMSVRTPFSKTAISIDFDLMGTLEEPQALGIIRVPDGIVRFPFAMFTITGGTIALTRQNPYTPELDIYANSRVYGYTLNMHLQGSAQEPQLTFTSSPALDSDQILLLVTTGSMPNDELARSPGSRLQGLGTYFGRTLLADFGLIDPYDTQLQITVGEDISDTGRETVRVEYKVDEEWSVVGEYDRYDTYNLNLRYKIYSE